LRTTGDLPPLGQLAQVGSETADFDVEMRFDHEVAQAVRQIQRRHGLHVDGIVGRHTLAALNVPVQERLQQLRHNLENGQLPEDVGDRYILVNIPDFTLRLIDRNREVWATRVVVGERQRRTPMLRSTIDHLVFNPYWHVPSRIAKQELLPRVVADPHYLAEQQMEIVAPSGQVLDPSGIDWTAVNAQDFPYRIRQRPGAHNALGRVKFIFPNTYGVYLHDTPSRALFARAERAFSHGCVRVEKPLELAAYLLRERERELRTPEQMEQMIRRGERTYVRLPQPIEVHFVYRTAWVDDDGTVQFRPDIYRHADTPSETLPILLASQ
jgi:murein L,D-transpeptidase YcbB/YkuD